MIHFPLLKEMRKHKGLPAIKPVPLKELRVSYGCLLRRVKSCWYYSVLRVGRAIAGECCVSEEASSIQEVLSLSWVTKAATLLPLCNP